MTEDVADLRGASVEAIIVFVFDHPEPRAGEDAWYLGLDIEANPTEQVRHLRQILRTADQLHPRFTASQLEQGFWFMFLSGDAHFACLLADEAVPFTERSTCIQAIYEAYAGLFIREPLGETSYMLWDLLLHAWDFKPPPAVADVMFETLVRMLDLPSAVCQRAALHGLGHLQLLEPEPLLAGSWIEPKACRKT